MKSVHGAGNRNAKIMIVGEAPGNEEVYHGLPFVGQSGKFLNEMLAAVGIQRDACFVSNVCHVRPPDNDISTFFAKRGEAKKHGLKTIFGKYPLAPVLEGISKLHEEMQQVNPDVVIACGNVALWALTGIHNERNHDPAPTGIATWRGSQLYTSGMWGRRLCVPVLHPAAVMRTMEAKWYTQIDLRRAASGVGKKQWPHPDYNFKLRPTWIETLTALHQLEEMAEQEFQPFRLSIDIETRKRHIACIGLAWSKTDAICIPIMCVERPRGYWEPDEEAEILHRIYALCHHPNVIVVGQNFDYDSQYFARDYGLKMLADEDTMIRQHTLFPGTPKGLDFLGSVYCSYYEYWKDEGKEWDPATQSEEQLWQYNCKDAVVTLEVAVAQEAPLSALNKREVLAHQMSQVWPVLKMELRGVRMDLTAMAKLRADITAYLKYLEQFFEEVVPPYLVKGKNNVAPWYRSPTQTARLIFDTLQQPTIMRKRGKGGAKTPSVDDDALVEIAAHEPILKPLCDALLDYRSYGNILANFVEAPMDPDHRFHTNINFTGTETFRYSSQRDVFGYGTNSQNLTKGD